MKMVIWPATETTSSFGHRLPENPDYFEAIGIDSPRGDRLGFI